ncbi:MAG: caspase family protein, partial [Micromonosporaceae bacterium]|nr:caspase family protein [Micromonosporaceae bacterium]
MADDDLVEAPLLPDERRSALVIATAAYQHRAYNPLPGSARDLTSMAEMLGDPKVCGFQVQTLLNKPYAEVWLAINRFFNSRTRDELLLVYFSGHGIMDDHGRLHLATTDTDPDTLAATSIAA